ncbi:UPF0678 fatty acid-binding protein-like protein [Glycine soja]|uniref:UPF0678 fatty acid-binding protein-like protein n=1 Tax=Glycine soja TaxID=3848 RepID=A0A0B2S7C2_GLYSO|nr:UPF0678 fatty acid-binding protein-like protein [Glycine soja]
MTSQAKPKQKIRRAPFRIAEQYSHRNIFQRKSKKNECKNEFFGAGNIAAGDPPGSGTNLLPSGHMERPRRRRLPHYQFLLLWRRASLLTFPPVIHPAVAPLSYLLGTWRGQGEGGFPTINSFSYGEELHFSHSPNKGTLRRHGNSALESLCMLRVDTGVLNQMAPLKL